MKVITCNVNGIRAAEKKGFFSWMLQEDPDIVCLQETKAQEHQLNSNFYPKGYEAFYFDAEKKGYSGVAILCKLRPGAVIRGLNFELANNEGRFIQADYQGISIASLYLPSGSSSDERQAAKYSFMDDFFSYLKKISRKRREYIICGDWNIAHKKIDLKNWRSNQANSGFLPEERAWMDQVIDKLGYVDAFREINRDGEEYTWWSNRGASWEKNVGWRLDYQITTPGLRNCIKRVSVYKEQRFSDHAPLIIEYDMGFSI